MRLDFAALSDPIQKNGGHCIRSHTKKRGDIGDNQYSCGFDPSPFARKCWGHLGTNTRPVIEGQDERPELSPMSPKCPQPWEHGKPSIHAVSPMSPVSPRINTRTRLTEAFEERAAIMEFDGGLSRAEAERLAAESLGVGA